MQSGAAMLSTSVQRVSAFCSPRPTSGFVHTTRGTYGALKASRLRARSPTVCLPLRKAQVVWATSAWSVAPPERLRLQVPTEDFQRSVELAPLSRPREGTVILVLDVAPGSASEAAGIRPGQQLLELSDPLRGGETWELNGLASIKYVRQAVGARARETINVSVTPEPVPEWEEAVAAARGHGNGASGSEVGQELSASEKAEVHSRLQSLQDAAVQQKKAVRQKKLDARNAYYEEGSSTSSKAPFMIGFGLFLGLPLVILAIAYSSGFFDSLGVGRTL